MRIKRLWTKKSQIGSQYPTFGAYGKQYDLEVGLTCSSFRGGWRLFYCDCYLKITILKQDYLKYLSAIFISLLFARLRPNKVVCWCRAITPFPLHFVLLEPGPSPQPPLVTYRILLVGGGLCESSSNSRPWALGRSRSPWRVWWWRPGPGRRRAARRSWSSSTITSSTTSPWTWPSGWWRLATG